jgi:hypothetical protein
LIDSGHAATTEGAVEGVASAFAFEGDDGLFFIFVEAAKNGVGEFASTSTCFSRERVKVSPEPAGRV